MTARTANGLMACFAILAATTISLIATGFAYGVNNNVYHIPYVLGYADLPQFRGDAFYASLNSFVSLIWPLLRAVSTEANAPAMFLTAHILSRLSAFVALYYFFRLNGITQRSALFVALAVAAATPWLMLYSVIGVHGLFIDYFTHSEVTWAPVIGAMLALQFRRFILMGVLSAITFCINPFIAFWLLFILAVPILACGYWRDYISILKAALVFLLISAPELYWTLSSIHGAGAQAAFDFRGYVDFYFPKHFLIDAAEPADIASFALIFVMAMLASLFTPDRRYWAAVVIGGLLILLFGSASGYLFNSKLLFNLELIRAAGILHFFGIVLAILALSRVALAGAYARPDRFLAVLGLMTLLLPPRGVPQLAALVAILGLLAINTIGTDRGLAKGSIAGLRYDVILSGVLGLSVLAYDLLHGGPSLGFAARWLTVGGYAATLALRSSDARLPWMRAASLIALALATSLIIARWRIEEAGKQVEVERPFIELTGWVRQHQLRGVYLIPVYPPHRDIFDRFQLFALQPVWVDWKQGAAVLWTPSFHAQWRRRMKEVAQLHGTDALLGYAAAHRVDYVILPRDTGRCPQTRTLFDNGTYAICRAANRP